MLLQLDLKLMPRSRDDVEVLPEAKWLTPIIFGSETQRERRRAVVKELETAEATTHLGLCEHLAHSRTFSDDPIISHLAHFSRLADAGMEAMDFVKQSVDGAKGSSITLADVAAKRDAKSTCKELCNAARDWLRFAATEHRFDGLSHIESADDFARAFSSEASSACLKALLQYHAQHGGGVLWFELRDGRVEPRSVPTKAASARYRFRLWSLCRLATQCGVLKAMPRAFDSGVDDLLEDDDE